MRVFFSGASRHDLRAIAGFIAVDNPARANSFLDELERACMQLAEQPLRFPLLPAFEAKAYRRRPYGNYAIIYIAADESVTVVRVLHTAMDLTTALGDS